MTTTLTSATLTTPIGELTLVADESALVAVLWPDDDPRRVPGAAAAAVAGERHPVLDRCAEELLDYFEGNRTSFDIPLAPRGTPFQQQVWAALCTIPYGETRSYGELAAAIGRPKSARAVGAANGRNPLSIVIPCHRVVGADGSLTGFAGGVDTKRQLLDLESQSI